MIKVIICNVEKYVFFKNFTYIIFDDENKYGLIIDPAWNFNIIRDKIEENKIILKGILITHNHIDHVNLAGELSEKYQCNVYMGQLGFFNINRIHLRIIESEESFFIKNIKIYPFFTPGHSPESICYLIYNNLFTGDTLFIEGCGMCFDDKSSPSLLYHSLQRLKRLIPPDTKIYPGHSYGELPGQEMSYLLKNNIYLNFKDEEDFIKFRMRKGQKNLFNFK
jgi:hydroxyacylglutathione hydrolase